jgi:hypothetical protein
MANQITDNRILLFDGGDGTGGQPVDLSGSAAGTADTSTYLQGATSYTYSTTNTRSGFLYDATTAQNWANNVFYFTVNSGVVGLLDLKANGGFTIRFCGATVTDFFEVYVGGSDSWPPSIQGGWTNFVVDIETAYTAAVTNGDPGTNTGGTPPATSAIRYVGFSQILTVMPKMADNTWFDTVHRLADGTAGILVEGRNAGTTDWNAADILTQLGSGQMAYYLGSGGEYILTTPIQFGINDTSTHGFTDTNVTWIWSDQEYAAPDLYGISALGNVGGTTNVTLGAKTGTGNLATGAQGFVIQAASTGVRWFLDFDDANLDSVGLYGCSFQHGADFQLDSSVVEVISSLYVDCTSATVSNSLQLKNSIINANTADGVAFMITDDLADIVLTTFQFSDGHAIELTGAAGVYTLDDVTFIGYGANGTNDAAIYVSAASGTFTINVDNATTERSPTATVNIVQNPVTTTVTATDADDGSLIQNARVLVWVANGTNFPYQASVSITGTGTTATVTHTAHGLATNDNVKIEGCTPDVYNGAYQITVTGVNTYTYTTNETIASSPATGTPTSTFVLINALTDVNGEASDSRTIASNQLINFRVRKYDTSPYYRQAAGQRTVDNSLGLDIGASLVSDE